MEISYDPNKNESCLNYRGFDFHFAKRVFYDPQRFDEEDLRHNYGESRRKVIGQIDDRHYTVVYTMREGLPHIITAWVSNRREVRKYDNNANQY